MEMSRKSFLNFVCCFILFKLIIQENSMVGSLSYFILLLSFNFKSIFFDLISIS